MFPIYSSKLHIVLQTVCYNTVIPNLYSPLRVIDYELTAGLTSAYAQRDLKDHLACLGASVYNFPNFNVRNAN